MYEVEWFGMTTKTGFSERITLPLTREMLDQIDDGLGDGEARIRFIRDAISNEISRRRALTYVRTSFSRANGLVFFKLAMVKGVDDIFTTSGFASSEGAAIIEALNHGFDFRVPAVVVLNMTSDIGEHGRVYALNEGRFEPMVDFPVGLPYLHDVLRAASIGR
jgi:hypothetical protein